MIMSCGAADARSAEPEAKAAIERGVVLRREHKDAQALAAFRYAYSVEPSPPALAQIALAEAALGDWMNAESDLARALAVATEPWVQRHQNALDAALHEIGEHLCTLEIDGPDGTEVWISGRLVAVLPQALVRGPVGRFELEFRTVGFVPLRRELNTLPGTTTLISIPQSAFEKRPMDRVAPPTPVAAAECRSRPASGHPMQTSMSVAWGAAGAAVALGVLGITSTVYGADRASYYNSPQCSDLAGVPRSSRCAAARSEVQLAQVAEVAAYGIGGLSALASVALFVKGRQTAPQASAPRVQLGVAGSRVVLAYAF